jgi:hypothetical protein
MKTKKWLLHHPDFDLEYVINKLKEEQNEI